MIGAWLRDFEDWRDVLKFCGEVVLLLGVAAVVLYGALALAVVLEPLLKVRP